MFEKVNTRFKYKIFRKNTRFKKYSSGYTKFIRRKYALIKRRANWQLYFLVPKTLFKFLINLKKLNSFLQIKYINTYPLTLNYNFLALGSSSLLPCNVPFNFSFINKKTYKFFFDKKQQVFLSDQVNQNNNYKLSVKVTRAIYFNSLPILEKLVNVGFLLSNNLFFKHNFPIKTLSSNFFLNITNFTNFFHQKPIVLILLSLRKVHIYLVIYKLM
jgi:hypothetical protein